MTLGYDACKTIVAFLPDMKPLSEAVIRAHTSDKVWERGEEYFAQGMVLSLVRRGDALHAQVEGSEVEPYRVSVQEQSHGGVEAKCTCPYMQEWDGWCKHIVAVLLRYAEEQDDVTDEKTVDELLKPLKKESLIALVVGLVEYDLALYEAVVELMNGRKPSRHRDFDHEWD